MTKELTEVVRRFGEKTKGGIPYESELRKLLKEDAFHFSPERVKELQNSAIKKAHRYHFNNNGFYRETKRELGEEIQQEEFWKTLIPSDVFKSYKEIVKFPEENPRKFREWLGFVSSIDLKDLPDISKEEVSSLDDLLRAYEDEGFLITHSSGTTGLFGFSIGDKKTTENLVKAWKIAAKELTPVTKDHYVIAGLPEHSYVYMAKAGNLFMNSLFYEDRIYHLIKRDVTPDLIRIQTGHPKNLVERIKGGFISLLKPLAKRKIRSRLKTKLKELEGENVVLWGPPGLLAKSADKIKRSGYSPKLGKKSVVGSGGGFPDISKDEFMKKVSEALNIPKTRIRDAYGYTESDSIWLECEGHKKHVPPWVKPFVLDEEGKPKPEEGKQTGQLGFIDLTISSYPSFVRMGNKGTVDYSEKCPECGRTGPILEPIIKRIGTGRTGCAAEIEESIG